MAGHSGAQADMGLEEEPRILHLDQQEAGTKGKERERERERERETLGLTWALKPQSPPPVTHFFQEGHIYSKKVTPSNIVTPSL